MLRRARFSFFAFAAWLLVGCHAASGTEPASTRAGLEGAGADASLSDAASTSVEGGGSVAQDSGVDGYVAISPDAGLDARDDGEDEAAEDANQEQDAAPEASEDANHDQDAAPEAAVDGCVPASCASLGYLCNQTVSDGCGGTLDCSCPSQFFCGQGTYSDDTCVAWTCANGDGCTPRTCGEQGFDCGTAEDGCGGYLNCGTCTAPETCGGAGVGDVCGIGDGGGCVKTTCADVGASCGWIWNNCDGYTSCGDCPSYQACGTITAGQCGPPLNCPPGTESKAPSAR